MHITALDHIAQYAKHKVWIKPSQEMAFLYGNNVLKSGLTMQKLRMHVLGSVELSATENLPAFVPSVLVMFAVLLTRLLT